jgi:fucose permease
MLVLGAGLQCTAHVIQAIAGPFPLFVSAYFFAGLGLSFQHAHCNAYVGLLDDRTKMGFLQAAYGVGAFAAPLVAVHFVAQSGSLWSFHYLTSIALAALNVAALAGVFRLRRLDGKSH